MGEWNYRKGRWNPWSKDGNHLALVRGPIMDLHLAELQQLAEELRTQ